MPDVRVSGTLEQLPAEALSQALQTIGVSISPQQIMAERLALKGKAVNPLPNVQLPAQTPMQVPTAPAPIMSQAPTVGNRGANPEYTHMSEY